VLDDTSKLDASAAGQWPTAGTDLPLAMTDQHLAQLFNKTPRTIRRWRKKNLLPPRTVGSFTVRDVMLAHLGVGESKRSAA
jgi:hypothetical protein